MTRFSDIFELLGKDCIMYVYGKGVMHLIFHKNKLPHLCFEEIKDLEVISITTNITYDNEPRIDIEVKK